MSPAPSRIAIPLIVSIAISAASAPAWAWPFGAAKPATPPATAPTASTPAAPAKTAPQKATPEQRAAADRMDLLSRSAFWAHEVNLDPTDTQAGVEFATALRLMGRNAEAVQAAIKVTMVDPKNLDALLETARAYIALNQGFYALDPLKRAEAIAPKDWRAYSLIGIAREQNQQPDDAHAAYLQALTLSPDNPAVLSNLALWCATHHDTAQAESLLRRAVAQPNSTARERQNLALVLGMEGRIGEAERLMREDLPPDIANNNLSYLKAVAGVAK